MLNIDDTITALGTPLGVGGIAIIRISGPNSYTIARRIFQGTVRKEKFSPWKVYLGKIFDDTTLIDEVLLTYFKSPHSYTKEDMVEIACHGGIYVARRILNIIIENGARIADPGEFTKRAFLNGRIDLSQAEAVADLIQSNTEMNLQISLRQMEGRLYRKIRQILTELIDISSLLEIELDFSEEDIEFVDRSTFITKLESIIDEINQLISTFKTGKIVREGARLVIVGKPNVGKSSLLNALLKEDRVIVNEFPGTTRDTIEEQLDIHGLLFNVVDTAGLGKTDDRVELEGISRTRKQMETADIIVHVLDGSEMISDDDKHIIDELITLKTQKEKKIIGVINKIDLKQKIQNKDIKYAAIDLQIIETSAMNMLGIAELEDTLYHQIMGQKEDILKYENNSEIIIFKLRHYEALKKTKEGLVNALTSTREKMSPEFITIDLRSALDSLGEIIGIVTNDDILNNIFEKFCIGK